MPPNMPLPESTGHELRDLLEQLNLIRGTLVATLALLVYEYLITFKDEKRLVWPSSLSTIKIVFLLNRYLPFVSTAGLTYGLVSVNVEYDFKICKPGFLVLGSMVFLTYVIAEFILYIRAYAAWGGNRFIGFILFFTFLGVVATGAVYIARFLGSLQVVETFLISKGCVYGFRNQVAWVSIVTLIASETFALVVLLARAPRLGQSRVMRMLIADGIFYYAFILLSSLVNAVILRLAPPTLCNFLLATQGALHSIFCNRLLLNIRGAYEDARVTPFTVSMRAGGTETQVLDSVGTVSAFQAANGLTLQSRGDVYSQPEGCYSYEEDC